MNAPYKYYAFISYSSKDIAWGKKLQRKLERYRMPATLCSEHGWERRPINPVFFAPTDIQPGGLTEEIQERLKASQNLIVICSRNSAKSEWVGKEIEYFNSLGRTKNIHFFIVDGEPYSGKTDTECINPIVDKLGLPEILGANIHEKIYQMPWLNRERAYVQLISKLLNVEFDTIWHRHRRRLVRKAIAWAIGIVAVLLAIVFAWRANRPFDVNVQLNEASLHNGNLPQLKNAVVTLHLDDEIKIDTIRTIDNSIVFKNIPHRYLNKMVSISVSCPTCQKTETNVLLVRSMTMDIYRDEHYYGDVSFRIFDPDSETYLSGVDVSFVGLEASSDSIGNVLVFVPLEKQQPYYVIGCSLPLSRDTIFMPSGSNDVILLDRINE